MNDVRGWAGECSTGWGGGGHARHKIRWKRIGIISFFRPLEEKCCVSGLIKNKF